MPAQPDMVVVAVLPVLAVLALPPRLPARRDRWPGRMGSVVQVGPVVRMRTVVVPEDERMRILLGQGIPLAWCHAF